MNHEYVIEEINKLIFIIFTVLTVLIQFVTPAFIVLKTLLFEMKTLSKLKL